jgi:hypothetical protein
MLITTLKCIKQKLEEEKQGKDKKTNGDKDEEDE